MRSFHSDYSFLFPSLALGYHSFLVFPYFVSSFLSISSANLFIPAVLMFVCPRSQSLILFVISFSFIFPIPVSTLLFSSCHNFYLCQENFAPVILSLYLSPSSQFLLFTLFFPIELIIFLYTTKIHIKCLPSLSSLSLRVKWGRRG